MKKTMIALGLVAVMLLGISYAYAHGPGFFKGPTGKYSQEYWGPGKVSSLTPEQEAKFQELRQKFNEETAQLRGALLTKRLELQSLWRNPEADSKAIMDKERELRDLQNQMRDKIVQNMLEARKLLTPEQIMTFGQGFRKGLRFGEGRRMGWGYERGCPGPGWGLWQ
jgi:Spy/CpxP family protein refolding chaperone